MRNVRTSGHNKLKSLKIAILSIFTGLLSSGVYADSKSQTIHSVAVFDIQTAVQAQLQAFQPKELPRTKSQKDFEVFDQNSEAMQYLNMIRVNEQALFIRVKF